MKKHGRPRGLRRGRRGRRRVERFLPSNSLSTLRLPRGLDRLERIQSSAEQISPSVFLTSFLPSPPFFPLIFLRFLFFFSVSSHQDLNCRLKKFPSATEKICINTESKCFVGWTKSIDSPFDWIIICSKIWIFEMNELLLLKETKLQPRDILYQRYHSIFTKSWKIGWGRHFYRCWLNGHLDRNPSFSQVSTGYKSIEQLFPTIRNAPFEEAYFVPTFGFLRGYRTRSRLIPATSESFMVFSGEEGGKYRQLNPMNTKFLVSFEVNHHQKHPSFDFHKNLLYYIYLHFKR